MLDGHAEIDSSPHHLLLNHARPGPATGAGKGRGEGARGLARADDHDIEALRLRQAKDLPSLTKTS